MEHLVRKSRKTYLIAEVGVNHNGDLNLAKRLIDKAVDSGADCVKFQTYVTDELILPDAEKAEYQKNTTGNEENQFEMLKKVELSFADFEELKDYCSLKEVDFLSTAFDFKSVDFLSTLNLNRWKIPSGEITNLPYLIEVAKNNKPVIISTGMSSFREIAGSIEVLREHGVKDITVLQCTTAYPAPMNTVDLNAMVKMRDMFGVEIGFSDHTQGFECAVAAVALGASVVEKHFTLDCNMKGPDHKASIEPYVFKAMVKAIRNIEVALGDGEKKLSEVEKSNRLIARKSIVAGKTISKGDIFSGDNLTTKRPGDGISPMLWFELIDKEAKRFYKKNEQIDLGELYE